MNEMTLAQYCKEFGQARAARQLDMSQPSIHKMVHGFRDIRIKVQGDAIIEAYEIKRVGRPRPAPAASPHNTH
jgi:hypothetical protein